MKFRLIGLIGLLAFLVSFVTFASPGNAQAALTLNNFVGFETNGLDEALATSGTPVVQGTTVRTGDFSLEGNASADEYDIAIITGGSTDSDNDFILGFGFQTTTLGGDRVIVTIHDDAGNDIGRIVARGDGSVRLVDANGVDIATSSGTPLSNGVWAFFELRWQHSATGAVDLYVDGVSQVSSASEDMTDGGAIGADSAFYRLIGNTNVNYFDDTYAYSGGTGTGDFLGDAEVFRYQSGKTGATPDAVCTNNVDLEQGVWDDLGETPVSSDATEPGYTGSGSTTGGSVYTDDTQSGDNFRHGPHGDSNIDGTIHGGKWLHRLRRSNGSGTIHVKCFGNDGDGTLGQAVTLSTAFATFFEIEEGTLRVPLDSEHFAFGIRKDGGGRDILGEELFAFILHVPDAGAPTRRIFPVQ